MLSLLVNPAIFVFNVFKSVRSLAAKAVTLAIFTATEVASLMVFNCDAVQALASSTLIAIVKALVPPSALSVVNSDTVSVVAMVAVTIPLVVAAKRFALSTLIVPESTVKF